MRHVAALAAALALASCVRVSDEAEPEPSARYTFRRPAPVADAQEPAQVLAASIAADWRPVDPENLLILDLADNSRVAIELAPDFAPVHVANIRAFARAGWWGQATIYRVQDNYVTQWGNGDSENPMPQGVVATPPAEYDRALEGLSPRPLGFPDSYAPMAGHANGWPMAWDPERGRAWLTHCYGSVGIARGLAPDTGSGSELYAVTGHAPRQLDLNIATVGRVLDGMSALSARPRGTGNLGFYQTERGEQPIRIARVRIAADIPAAERPAYEVMRTDGAAFSAYVTGRANRGGTFFRRPAGGVDVCNVNVPVRARTAAGGG
ncbi:MAG TPA: peptidylprolyl isomerase [Allosphingosinicella sp.]|jgi:peptidylprolyl isomerase